MSRSHIDFASPSVVRTWRTTSRLTLLILAIGAGLSVGIAYEAFRFWEQYQQNHSALTSLAAKAELKRRREIPAPVTLSTLPQSQVKAVNEIISRLNIPWTALFDAIEEATPVTIAVLSLEPDVSKKLLRGQAEARNSDDMIRYLEQLKKMTIFQSVILVRHETNTQDPNRPLRFQFEASWIEEP